MKKCVYLILLLLVVFLFAACEEEEVPLPTEPEKFNIQDVTFIKSPVILSEAPYSEFNSFGLNKNLEIAEINGVTYAFEPQISNADREACIQTTQAVLDRIGTSQKLRVNVYTSGTYSKTFIEDSSIFTCLQDWKSPKYVSSLLLGLFGEYSNYGAAYGYSSYLLNDLFEISLPLCDADWKYDGDTNALDLNYLCFRAQFFTGKDIKAMRRLANTFVTDYISANGETAFQNLLVLSGDPEAVNIFNEALTAFYQSRGITHTPSEILYRPGGKTYDYIAKCKFATMYIDSTWKDVNMQMCPYSYDGILHKNYADVRYFFTTHAAQMEQYQQLFALEDYNNNLCVLFSNTLSQFMNDYNPNTHSITIRSTGYFMTCYIRSLVYETIIKESWAYAGVTNYFSSYYDYIGTATTNAVLNSFTDAYEEYREKLGRDIDIAVDIAEVLHIDTYCGSYDDPNDTGNYNAGASFVGYLISRFGEAEAIEMICVTHDFWGYTYEALVADWQAFIQENYSGYTKYR